MRIEMIRYMRARAYASIDINESVLREVNEELNDDYVLVSNPEEAPQIESVADLEKLIKERGCENEDDEVRVYYNRLNHKPMYSQSLSGIVYDMITDMLYDIPYEIDDAETDDVDFEVV